MKKLIIVLLLLSVSLTGFAVSEATTVSAADVAVVKKFFPSLTDKQVNNLTGFLQKDCQPKSIAQCLIDDPKMLQDLSNLFTHCNPNCDHDRGVRYKSACLPC